MYYIGVKLSGHLRILEKCRKHSSPAACVFYISLGFPNVRRVLSQCNRRLRLLYLLNNKCSPLFIITKDRLVNHSKNQLGLKDIEGKIHASEVRTRSYCNVNP